MQKYLGASEFVREGASNRTKTVCPFHSDSAPSLILYDKTDDGAGWDYHCFSCGAHGNAVTMLTHLNIAQSEEHAIDMLMKDFNLQFPVDVTVHAFCDFKGLDKEFALANGWENTKQGVAIPYYDTKQNVVSTKIRTKYQGKDKYIYQHTSGNPIAHVLPYGLHWVDAYDDGTLYITEGETDCMTLRQAGFQAIGFPSTNGFKPEFAAFLKKYKSLVIVRDNDEAGWHLVTDIAEQFPDNLYMVVLPNGVKDINSYHTTKCRGEISKFKELFPALQILPASPETFLSAVKNGDITPTEKACWEMVARYYTSEVDRLYYKERMSKEAKVSKAVLSAAMKQVDIRRDELKDLGEFTIVDNCYYKLHPQNGKLIETRVSNFILVPEYDIVSEDDIIRVVTLVNQQGEERKGIRLDKDALTTPVKFNACVVGQGNFIFTGNAEDLFKLNLMIFERTKSVVYSPKKIGRLETGGWLFGNCGIDSKGELHEVRHGIVELDGKVYAPRSITVDDEAASSSDVPTFNLRDYTGKPDAEFLRETAESLRTTFGTYGAYLALGWCIAGWFSNQIFDKFGFYPYLFISGKRASGKSVLATLLTSTFGFEAASAGMSIETPTNVGILRYLGYRSSLPCWYDDYRSGVRRIDMKDGLLLDVYNRHGSVKGTKDAGVIRKEQVNGFVLLSGEDTPSNNALLTRCVVVQLSAADRDPRVFDEACANMELLRSSALWFAKQSTLGADISEHIEAATQKIFDKNGDIRYARNYGIFAGAFLWAFGDVIPDKDKFLASLTKNAYQDKLEIDAAHPMAEFFNDFPDMIAKGFVVRDRDFTVLEQGGNKADKGKRGMVALRMRECHKGWCDYHRDTKLKEKTLRDYVRREPFFHSEERAYFSGAGRFNGFIVDPYKMQEEFEDFCEAVYRDDADEPY